MLGIQLRVKIKQVLQVLFKGKRLQENACYWQHLKETDFRAKIVQVMMTVWAKTAIKALVEDLKKLSSAVWMKTVDLNLFVNKMITGRSELNAENT